jgi:3-phosphoshikimate 1-carboxyvinyltransferase
VTVRGTGTLRGVEVDLRDLSDMVPTLAAVAVFADTPTTITGVGFIRGKESDRIGDLARELHRCGIDASEHDDGLTIHPGQPRPARIRTYDDHRLAMAFALIGLRAPGIEIEDPECVAKTFPGYFDALDRLR